MDDLDDWGYYDERMTGITWVTGMTRRIRMNRMTINERTWMAGISRMTGMTKMNRMT